MDTKAAFEKWLKEKMPNLYHMAFIAEEDEMTNHFKASVFDMRTAWEAAWTASRAAIEIQFERFKNPLDNAFADGYNDAINDIEHELTSHGLTIKK